MRAFSMAFLAILACVSAARPQEQGNLVNNGDFEMGFKDGVAIGWQGWADGWGGREYYDETAEVHAGQHAQGWRTVVGSSSGIHQVVTGLRAGQPYRLTMWTQYQSPGVMWAECGFDLAGGTDPFGVKWTKMEGDGKAGRWLRYQADFVADGESVSIWYKWGSRGSSLGMADDVVLEPIDTTNVDWGSAAGTVWAMGGPPLPGATVTMRPGRASMTTRGDGTFAFDRVYRGTYTFAAEKPGYLPDTVSEATFTDGEQRRVDLVLKRFDYIVGGDFETGFTEGVASCWTPWYVGDARFEGARSTEVRHGGGAAQHWETIAGQSGIRQIVAGLEEGAAYDLSLWVLPEQGEAIRCGYDLTGGRKLADATWLAKPVPTDADWQHYAAGLTPERDRVTIWLSWTEGAGVVDDVSLTRHDPDLDIAQ